MIKSRRLFFSVARVIFIFIIGLVAAFVVALYKIDLKSMRQSILGSLQESIGMPVEINGNISWRFSLRPRLVLNKVSVASVSWSVKCPKTFEAEKIDVTLDLLSLFGGKPVIHSLKLYNANVCVEKNTKGEISVKHTDEQVFESANVTKSKYPFTDIGIENLEIKKLKLFIVDKKYSINGLAIRYKQETNKQEYSGWIKPYDALYPFVLSFDEYIPLMDVYPVKLALGIKTNMLITDLVLDAGTKKIKTFKLYGKMPDVTEFLYRVGLDTDLNFSKVILDVSGTINNNNIILNKSEIQLQDSKFKLNGSFSFNDNNKNVLKLNLSSDNVNLMHLYPDLYKGVDVTDRDLNVFHDMPLYGKELFNYDIDIKLNLKNFIVYRDLNLKNLNIDFVLANGVGHLDSDMILADGHIDVASNININEEGHVYTETGLKVDKLVLGNLLKEIRIDDVVTDLPLNLQAYFIADGTNMEEIMQTITGPVQMYSAAPGHAGVQLVSNMYGEDFLTFLRHNITDMFRKSKKYDTFKISCVAVNSVLNNGVLAIRDGAAIETNSINARFIGYVDLGQEKIKMALTTMPVRGLKLSLTGIANTIEFSGNLAEPDITLSGSAVVGKLASATGIGLLLAPLTGGLSVVAGAGVGLLASNLIDNWLADEHPCKTIRTQGDSLQQDLPKWLVGLQMEDLLQNVFDKKE